MRRAISDVAALLGTLTLCGCGGGPKGSDASTERALAAAGMDAIEIAQLVYNGGPRTPEGFYAEPARSADVNYSTFHLRNTRVDLAAAADPATPEFELCATSQPEAAAWEHTDRQNNLPGAQLLGTRETDKLYELERDVPGTNERREVVRLFKCAFLDRSSVNLRAPDGHAGRINLQPPTVDDVRFLAEYLWTFSFYNNVGNAVIDSRRADDAVGLTHVLTQAELQSDSGSDGCAVLAVFTASYAVTPGSGEITYQEDTLWHERVRQVAGRAELCE